MNVARIAVPRFSVVHWGQPSTAPTFARPIYPWAEGNPALVALCGAAAGCRVTYTITHQWPGGFGAAVDIVNLGDPVSSWNLVSGGTGTLPSSFRWRSSGILMSPKSEATAR